MNNEIMKDSDNGMEHAEYWVYVVRPSSVVLKDI